MNASLGDESELLISLMENGVLPCVDSLHATALSDKGLGRWTDEGFKLTGRGRRAARDLLAGSDDGED